MTLEEFIALVEQELLTGGDAMASSFLNMTQTIESLLQPVFESVSRMMAADPDKQLLLRRTHTVALTAGVGDLPAEALTQCAAGATLSDPDDATIQQDMSYVPQWNDFLEAHDYEPRLGYWHIKDNGTTGASLYYVRPSDTLPAKTGDVDITIASVPQIPADATDPLEAPPEFINRALAALVNATREGMARAA